MKTITDLHAITPAILESFDEAIHGNTDECRSYEFFYEEDGWCVDATYTCEAEWDENAYPWETEPLSVSGKVVRITVYHTDEESEEETEFSGDDLENLVTEMEACIFNF